MKKKEEKIIELCRNFKVPKLTKEQKIIRSALDHIYYAQQTPDKKERESHLTYARGLLAALVIESDIKEENEAEE